MPSGLVHDFVVEGEDAVRGHEFKHYLVHEAAEDMKTVAFGDVDMVRDIKHRIVGSSAKRPQPQVGVRGRLKRVAIGKRKAL